MSRIDGLIARHCPDGVAYRPLGDVGQFVRGSGLQKKDFVDDGFPCIHYGEIYTYYGTTARRTKSFVTPELAGTLKQAQPGNLVVTTTSENIADVCTAVAWLGESPVAIGGHACVYRHDLDPLYVAHWFKSERFQAEKRRFVSGTKVKDIKASDLARIRIPVPPLAVQKEIGRVLDEMEQLQAVLEQEVRTREVQGQALMSRITARDAGPSVEHGYRQVRLGDVGRLWVDPVTVEPTDEYVNLGVRWYGQGVFARPPKKGSEIKGSTLYRVRPGQFMFNRMFVVEGSFGVVPEMLGDGVVSGEFPRYELDRSQILPEWLTLHLLQPKSLQRIEAEVTGVERGSTKSRRRWKEEQFEEFVIDLPPLRKQEEVVRAMAAVAELQEQLRQELDARRRQLGFYRDRLLSLPERVA